MLKKYLSDIAFMQVLNLLVKPVWILVIDRAVQNTLTQEIYGNYFALFNFSLMFFIILDLGLNGYNTTEISRDTNKIVSFAGNIIGLKILLMILYLIAAFGVGSLLGYNRLEFNLLLILCILQIITSFNQYLRSIVSSLQKFKWDGVFMVLDRVVIISICSVLIWGGISDWELTINRFVYAQLMGVSLVTILLVVFLRKQLSKISISFQFQRIVPILKKSWPFALLIMLMGLYNYMDSVMLKLIIGDEEAGVYALGYRLFYALLMFAQIFSGVLLPFFSKNINDVNVVRQVSNYTSKLLFLIGFSVIFYSYSYGMDIMQLLYPDKATAASSNAFVILMFGFIGSVLVLVYGTLLTAALELKYLNMAAFATLVINLVLNVKLIPQYGASGAAIATLVSQLIFGGVCFMISFQKFNFKLKWVDIFNQLGGVMMLLIIIIFSKQYFDNVLVHSVLIAVVVLLVAYLFKLFNVKHLNR
ncbi:MAG: oligosaccharide flippase family protein [Bacteroidota bacterium]